MDWLFTVDTISPGCRGEMIFTSKDVLPEEVVMIILPGLATVSQAMSIMATGIPLPVQESVVPEIVPPLAHICILEALVQLPDTW